MIENFEEVKWPTKSDLTEAFGRADLMSDAGNIHMIANLKNALLLNFMLAEEGGWNEDLLTKYLRAEQILRLYSENKIKKLAPYTKGFVWTVDNSPYDENSLIQ